MSALVAACDLDLVIHLPRGDPSLEESVADQLELTAGERLARLMPATTRDDAIRALRWLAEARTPAIVIGGVGDVDERWADVDRRAPTALPNGGTIVLASNVPGTGDYRDLRRSARTVELDDGVVHPWDLLRMVDASPRESERARVPGLRALLSHTRPAYVQRAGGGIVDVADTTAMTFRYSRPARDPSAMVRGESIAERGLPIVFACRQRCSRDTWRSSRCSPCS